MDRKVFLKTLKTLASGNAEYAAFNKRVANTGKDVLGVRMPDMRRLAKSIAKDCDATAVRAFLDEADKNSFEQVLIAGLIIDYAKLDEIDKIALTRAYLPHVDSWALVDSFTDKMKRFDEKLWWDFALACLASPEEFTVRAGVMRLMVSFLDERHLAAVFDALRAVRHDGYYVKMGMAWLYATAATVDFALAVAETDAPETDPWTRGKALQKMLESNRLSDEQKAFVRSVRASGK